MEGIRMHSFNEKKVEEKEPIDVYSLIDENEKAVKIIDVREPFEYYGDMGHVKDLS